MRAAARAAFYDANAPIEGVVEHMYLDVLGLVTVGVGNLIDPRAAALGLPWLHRGSGLPATRDEIAAEWLRIKGEACGRYEADLRCAWRGTGRTCLAHQGHRAAAQIATLYLPEQAIRELVLRRLDEMIGILRGRFVGWEKMPADAQLAVACLAWAVGPRFRWPRYEQALARGDYTDAVLETSIREEGNPGVRPRNAAMRRMLNSAAWVVAYDADRDVLHYPRRAGEDAATVPELPAVDSSPVVEDDGGASRRAATSDAVRVPRRYEEG